MRPSFSPQTATDRFSPDFLCPLEGGRILAVAYKNTRDGDLPDNIEKRRLGELWERPAVARGHSLCHAARTGERFVAGSMKKDMPSTPAPAMTAMGC